MQIPGRRASLYAKYKEVKAKQEEEENCFLFKGMDDPFQLVCFSFCSPVSKYSLDLPLIIASTCSQLKICNNKEYCDQIIINSLLYIRI